MSSQTVKALKVEAKAEDVKMIVVDFRGDEYLLPANAEEWDVEVMEALEDERLVGCLRALLGETQWASLKRRHKPKMKELDEIADAFLSAVGLSVGKSES